MNNAENQSQDSSDSRPIGSPDLISARLENNKPVSVDPDLGFILNLKNQGGVGFKKCIQCGTCSGTCTLSPDKQAFPGKEMAWASWGMKDRLIEDLDIWLCHQCNDCTARCPRGASPGDVLAAVRQECVPHFSFPAFFARLVNQPQGIPLLLGIPAALLTLAVLFRFQLAEILGITASMDDRLVFSYSTYFPHWLLNGFFGFFTILVFIVIGVGVMRFWKTMTAASTKLGYPEPVQPLGASIIEAAKSIVTHEKFDVCEEAHTRLWSHALVFYGFLSLIAVTIWVITAPYNPLIDRAFIYPFSFFSPWKMLANIGGLALLVGLCLMAFDRLRETVHQRAHNYSDWALLSTFFLVVTSGFVTEALHYVRLEPHRHLAYFGHLVFVFALLVYLPYSKLAHVIYRTTAIVFAARYGRRIGEQALESPTERRYQDKEADYANTV